MTGAWTSGGIEWCVLHHHRASSFLPMDYEMVENIDLMKRLDLQSEQVQIVGYVEDNIFRCSSHGHHDIYI